MDINTTNFFIFLFGYECIYIVYTHENFCYYTNFRERRGTVVETETNYEFTFISFTDAIVNALGLIVMIQQNAIS